MPQAWFLHFYLLGCCCNAAVLVTYAITVDAAAWTSQTVGPTHHVLQPLLPGLYYSPGRGLLVQDSQLGLCHLQSAYSKQPVPKTSAQVPLPGKLCSKLLSM